MRHAQQRKTETNDEFDICPTSLIGLASEKKTHTVEVDIEALEEAGLWGVAKLEIAGKTYQLFPVISA